jgi:hypothetical protein
MNRWTSIADGTSLTAARNVGAAAHVHPRAGLPLRLIGGGVPFGRRAWQH